MALTPEQRRSVVKAALARRQKGLPPLVPSRNGEDSASKRQNAKPKKPAK